MIKVVTALSLLGLLIGCSRFQSPSQSSSLDQSLFSAGDPGLNPSTDKLSADCRTDTQFDACVILKNPVAQLKTRVTQNSLDEALRFGVKIRGLNATGNLENSRFQILTLHSRRFSILDRSQFKAKYSSQESFTEQVNAYYWANRVLDYLGGRVGQILLPVQGLKIYVDDTFTGFSSAQNSISLQKKSALVPKALQAEVLIQLIGQALAHQLSDKKIFDLKSTAKHNICNLDPKGCCSSVNGCSNALASAFGDYLVAVMFPTSPTIGESIAQSTQGQELCGMKRNVELINRKTQQEAFMACTNPGNVTLMGNWYASKWWKIRQELSVQNPTAARDIDILFFQHAQTWTTSSQFADTKAKALELARNYQSGKYLSALQSAFKEIN